jgi:DNA-binding NarL/FixJ family response regulator
MRGRCNLSKSNLTMINLTDREREFIRLLGHDLKVKDIAELMFISIELAWQISIDLKKKTNTYNLHGLCIWAVKNGIIQINIETLPPEERKAS